VQPEYWQHPQPGRKAWWVQPRLRQVGLRVQPVRARRRPLQPLSAIELTAVFAEQERPVRARWQPQRA
jgi:hypothetical protein